MARKNEFMAYLLELLEPLGSVEAKAMFGGYGVYKQGLMFGLVSDDTFYLKADDKNRGDFESKDMPPFTYKRKAKTLSMSYFQAPPDVMENSDELCEWAIKAYDAAMRAGKGKKKEKRMEDH